MKDSIFYIVAAGEKTELNFLPTKGDYVVAVDGGYDYLLSANIKANLVIGDMDSISSVPVHDNIIRLKKEKDDTDTLAAIKIGLEKGYKNFHIYCGMGGRISHTFANIQCLEYIAKHGGHGYLFGRGQIATVISNDEIVLQKKEHKLVSVFSLTPKAVVTLEGLKYSGNDIKLTSDYPLGVSNEFSNKQAKIIALDGNALIIFE